MEDILSAISPIFTWPYTVGLQHSFVAPAPYGADADLEEIRYLPAGEHRFQRSLFYIAPHNELPVRVLKCYQW